MIDGSNLRTIAMVVRFLAFAVMALGLIAALATLAWLFSYAQGVDTPLVLLATQLLSAVLILLFYASGIPVLIWVFLAHRNLQRAGVPQMRHGPGWAVTSYFVPVANLFVPFQAMRELHNRSHGEPADFGHSSVDSVTSWWACYLGAMFFSTVVALSVLVDSIPGFFVTTPFWANDVLSLLFRLLLAASAWFLQVIVREVTAAQERGGDVSQAFA